MAKAIKKETSPTKEGDFVAKKIGANLIVTVHGTAERYSKKLSLEDAEKVMHKMSLYNKKPTESNRKAILKMLSPEQEKKKVEKEKAEVRVKGVKKLIKREEKKEKKEKEKEGKATADIVTELEAAISEDETIVPRLKELLKRLTGKAEEVPVVTAAPTRRFRDEY